MTLYDLLLRLYPAAFRNEYGDEMRPLFARQRRAARGVGVATLWLATLGDVLRTAAAAHLDLLVQDLSYAGRMLHRSPAFAITAVGIVALGIGAATAAFSVTDFVLFRPLPFPDPDRLVKIWETTPGYGRMELSAPNYRDWRNAATSYSSMGMYHFTEITMTGAGEPRRLYGSSISADLLPTLGAAPMLGRAFVPDDDRAGAAASVLLSYRLWQSVFGGDPDVVGRTLVFDGAPHTVLGVMPRTFHFPTSDTQFWTTTRFGEDAYQDSERTNNWLEAVGRLRPGVSITEAHAEMQAIAARSREQYPRENKDTGASVVGLGTEVSERSRLLLLALMGAAGCLLLIACANLANLLLARALVRRRELAVRAAMGAGRERLVRQLMTENLLLAVAGGALGILVAVVSVPMLARLVPATMPIAASPSIDPRVLIVAIALTALTALMFGSAPLLRLGSGRDMDGLRGGARSGDGGKERLRAALVVAEIVASVVLLVSAGLLIRALLTVQAIDTGFEPEGVLTMETELPMPQYASVATREAFYAHVLEQVRAMPGVKAAGYVSFLPMSAFRGGIWPVSVQGDAEAATDIRSANHVACLRYVTPGYFEAMGIPLLRGRDIEEGDTRDRLAVAVVSASFVRRYWPDQDPIGRRFTFAFAEREVVGVVGDVRFRGLERESEPQVYLSSRQVDDGAITFYVPKALAIRTAGEPAALVPAVRDVIRQADPKLPITDAQALTELVARDTASRSVQVRVLSAFAAIAIVLAGVGIHGLLSFTVSQRAREFAVRLALGASSRDILSIVVRRCLVLAVAGVVPGLLLASLIGRSLEALLAGVKPADAPTLGGVIALTGLMTVLGGLVPAIRAARVDPVAVLRSE